jgi:hypothetical protein
VPHKSINCNILRLFLMSFEVFSCLGFIITPKPGLGLSTCHTRFQGVEPSAYHMCARIDFHTYVDVTSVIYQKTMQ